MKAKTVDNREANENNASKDSTVVEEREEEETSSLKAKKRRRKEKTVNKEGVNEETSREQMNKNKTRMECASGEEREKKEKYI